jgi:hypothetical protein
MERVKLNLRKMVLLALCLVGVLVSSAFAKSSTDGFWTIEANDKSEKYTVVRFYDDKQNLIYEEKIEGIALSITPKNKKVLEKTLSMLINKKLVKVQIKNTQLMRDLR